MVYFAEFCKKNYALLAFAAFWVFISFGARLFFFTIGPDTVDFIANKEAIIGYWLGINRTALIVLKNLWHINLFNPFYSTVIAMILLALSAVSWAFLISYFDKRNDKRLPVFAFVSVMASSAIWAENLQFALQCAEIFFGIFCTPFAAVMLFAGFAERSKKKIIAAILLMAVIIDIYQGFAVLFIFAAAVGFVFLSGSDDFDKKLPLKIFSAFLISLAVYWLIGQSAVLIFQIERPDYLARKNLWSVHTVKSNLLNIIGFAYILTFAKIPFVHSIVSSVFLDKLPFTETTGMSVSGRAAELSAVFGSIALLPLIVVFLIYLFREKRRRNRLVYLASGILVPLSVMLLGIALGNKPPIRSLFAHPLVFGFIFYFIISNGSKRIAYFFAVLAFIIAVNSSQISSVLLYSDGERFRQDVALAQQIDFEIKKLGTEHEGKKVVLIGERKTRKNANYIRGEVIGFSVFEFDASSFLESSGRGILFLKALGMNYEHPDSADMEYARSIQKEMPYFPQQGSIKDCGDFLIVKLSESSYRE